MQKNILHIILLVLFAGFISCESINDNFVECESPIELSISVDKPFATTRATKPDKQGTNDENLITDLYIFLFSPDGSELFRYIPIHFSNDALTQSVPWTNTTDPHLVLENIYPSDLGTRRVYVVANAEAVLHDRLMAVRTEKNLMDMVYDNSLGFHQITTPLMMQGYADKTFTATDRRIEINLKRLVSKIDLTLFLDYAGLDDSQENKYQPRNLNSRTYVVENAEIPAFPVTLFRNYPNYIPFTEKIGTSGKIIRMQQYIYEGDFTGGEAFNEHPYILLQLPSTLSGEGKDNFYRVQLPEKIDRNRIYRLESHVTERGKLSPENAVLLDNTVEVIHWEPEHLYEDIYGKTWLTLSDSIVELNYLNDVKSVTAESDITISYRAAAYPDQRVFAFSNLSENNDLKWTFTFTSDAVNHPSYYQEFSADIALDRVLMVYNKLITKTLTVKVRPSIRLASVSPFVVEVSPNHLQISSDRKKTPVPTPTGMHYRTHVYEMLEWASMNSSIAGTAMMDWNTANTACDAANGWRLPTEYEMKAWVRTYLSGTAAANFYSELGRDFWTATMDPTYAGTLAFAKYATINIGYHTDYADLPMASVTEKKYVRCVRDYNP